MTDIFEKQLNYLIAIWENNDNFITILTSEELFFMISLAQKFEAKSLIKRDFNLIIDKIILNYNLCDLLTIYSLIELDINKDYCNKLLHNTVYEVFDTKTLFFIKIMHKKVTSGNKFRFNDINELIYQELNNKSSIDAAKILIDLFYFQDFKDKLKNDYPTAYYVIRKNIEVEPLGKNRNIALGKSIIGKLIIDDNESIVANEFNKLKSLENPKEDDIKLIGVGSCSIVFKIGNYVLKIGEHRNVRRIYINHRILASKNRKLHLDRNGNALFYTETMRFAVVGNVTEEERDELVDDLRKQGLIWDDTKLENCGVLMPDDNNEWNFEGNFDEEIAGIIDNPVNKEEFNKRKRKVIVIDNDNMRRDPKSYWK